MGDVITRGYACTRDGQLHYRRTGKADAMPIVFLHQTASSGAMFELVMRQMLPTYAAIAFDTPGFGNSFVPHGDISLVYLAERLIEALDDLGVGQFDLCGHHTGGCIALEIAHLIPARVNSFTLIGPVIASAAERDSYRGTFTAPFAFQPDGSHLQIAWDYLSTIGAAQTPALHQREMIDHLLGMETMPKAFSAVWDQDSEARLRAISAPILLMCSQDDVLWRIFHHAVAVRPDAEVAIVQGMDFQPDNDPDGVATALMSFIEKGREIRS